MQSSGDDVQVMNMDIRERETAAHDVREETSGALTRIRVLTLDSISVALMVKRGNPLSLRMLVG